MGRPKGIEKVPGSGRKPGATNKVPNAVAIKESFAEACARLNFDPIAKLASIIDQLEPGDQAKTIVQILPYLHAVAKATEAPQSPLVQIASFNRDALLKLASNGDDE